MWWMFRLRKKRSTLSRPDALFVRTLQAPDQLVFNKATNEWELSSQAFSASSTDGSLSGDLEELLEADGLETLSLYPSLDRAVGAVGFTVQTATGLGLTVGHEPMKANWYHGGVRGNLNKGNKRKLKDAAISLVAIDQKRAQIYDDQKRAAAAEKAASANAGY
jgi:hypothetical protein